MHFFLQQRNWLNRLCFIALFLFGMSACATIPKESSDLSMELGKRISAIENAHTQLVTKYFGEKRERVDEFMMREWVPEFASNFFKNIQIANLWDQVVQSNDPNDRLQFLVKFGPEIQSRINKKRLEFIKPLDDAERLLKERLKVEYQQARAINNSITSFLVSASKVEENRKRYLEMLEVEDNEITGIINEIDDVVGMLSKTSDRVMSKEKKAEEFLEKFEKVKKKLTR